MTRKRINELRKDLMPMTINHLQMSFEWLSISALWQSYLCLGAKI